MNLEIPRRFFLLKPALCITLFPLKKGENACLINNMQCWLPGVLLILISDCHNYNCKNVVRVLHSIFQVCQVWSTIIRTLVDMFVLDNTTVIHVYTKLQTFNKTQKKKCLTLEKNHCRSYLFTRWDDPRFKCYLNVHF